MSQVLFKKSKNEISLVVKACFVLVIVALAQLKANAQEAPPHAQISNVVLSGSGCGPASASVSLSPDLGALSILFDNFILNSKEETVNPSTLRVEKSCNVQMDITVPDGWSMALKSVDYRGFASVPENAMGYHRFTLLTPRNPVSMRQADFRGPFNDNFFMRAIQKPGRYAWTSCSRGGMRVNMISTIGVYFPIRNNYPEAMVALDSQDVGMSEVFQVEWQRCR